MTEAKREITIIIGLVLLIMGISALFLWRTGTTIDTPTTTAAPPIDMSVTKAKRRSRVEVNQSTGRIWAFEFEGKRCLWLALGGGGGGHGGLTCWNAE